jgi:hypothetical protein
MQEEEDSKQAAMTEAMSRAMREGRWSWECPNCQEDVEEVEGDYLEYDEDSLTLSCICPQCHIKFHSLFKFQNFQAWDSQDGTEYGRLLKPCLSDPLEQLRIAALGATQHWQAWKDLQGTPLGDCLSVLASHIAPEDIPRILASGSEKGLVSEILHSILEE